MAKKRIFILIAFLVGIALVSIFKYSAMLKEKRRLLKSLQETGLKVEVLEREKQNLLQDLEKSRVNQQRLAEENLNLTQRVAQLDSSVVKAQLALEALNTQLSLIRAENSAIRQQQQILTLRLVEVAQERDTLSARFNSVVELKRAIKDLKRSLRRAPQQVAQKTAQETRSSSDANREVRVQETGPFINRIKIQVLPAP